MDDCETKADIMSENMIDVVLGLKEQDQHEVVIVFHYDDESFFIMMVSINRLSNHNISNRHRGIK